MDYNEAKKLIKSNDLEKLDVLLSKMETISLSDVKKLIKLTDSEQIQRLVHRKYNEMMKSQESKPTAQNERSLFEEVKMQKENVEDARNKPSDASEVLEEILTGNLQKDKSIKMFFDAFRGNISDCDDKSAAVLAKQITFEIFERKSSDTAKLIRSKCLNLKDKNNPSLCRKVYNGDICASRYVEMTAEEMKSEILKNEEIKMIKDSLYECQIPTHKAETDIFKCSKCGERKCSYRQLQTRSGDEPMTTFVSCECGHKWRFC